MSQYKKTQIKRSLRQFSDIAGDLLSADYGTFDDRINKFCDFCKTDPVFSNIHEQIQQAAQNNDFDSWLEERMSTGGSFVGSGRLIFPTEDETRISFMYEILFRMHANQISFFDFTTKFFAAGSRIDDNIYALNDAVTHPMLRDLGYRLEEMDESIDEASGEYVPASTIQIIHRAENVIQQNATGTNISLSANITNNPVNEHFDKLVEMAGDNRDDLETIEAAREEATKQEPRKSVVKRLLGTLSFAGSAASVIGLILSAI